MSTGKKILLVFIALLIIWIISMIFETYYCNALITVLPFDAPDDYIKNNLFCYINTYLFVSPLYLFEIF